MLPNLPGRWLISSHRAGGPSSQGDVHEQFTGIQPYEQAESWVPLTKLQHYERQGQQTECLTWTLTGDISVLLGDRFTGGGSQVSQEEEGCKHLPSSPGPCSGSVQKRPEQGGFHTAEFAVNSGAV